MRKTYFSLLSHYLHLKTLDFIHNQRKKMQKGKTRKQQGRNSETWQRTRWWAPWVFFLPHVLQILEKLATLQSQYIQTRKNSTKKIPLLLLKGPGKGSHQERKLCDNIMRKHKLPQFTQYKIDNVNSPIISKEIKSASN